MAGTDLRVIGAILMVSVGVMSLYFIRKNSNLSWDQRLGAHILCWLFIAKGIGNMFVDSLIKDLTSNGYTSGGIWQFEFSILWLMDILFGVGMLALCLVFPLPILRTKKQLKIAFSIVLGWIIYKVILFVLGFQLTILELPGILYFICGTVWVTIYVKFRLIPKEKRNQSTNNIALAAGLLLVFHFGHIWFSWTGLFLRADYFYFQDLMEEMSHRSVEYMWQASYAFAIGVGMAMLAIEVKEMFNGNKNQITYFIISYFTLGFIGYTILSSTSIDWWDAGDTSLAQIWVTLTSSMHFTVVRPLIGMYILLRFGLFDTSEEMKPRAKMMVIILIVIATSALLELVQAIIPINEMFSAALLGIIVAFGIGWEERSFDNLVNSPSSMKDGVDERWYPEIELPNNLFKNIDAAVFITIITFLLIGFLQWRTNALYELILRRIEGGW
jgi:hypothetical protein